MAGDVLQVGTTTSQLTVDSVDASHVWVVYDQPNSLSIPQGTILLAITRPADIFADAYAQVPYASGQRNVDSTGRAAFFQRNERADALVTGTGFSARLYASLEGGFRASDVSWLNAKDFPTIQAAVDALPREGGTVFIPAGAYTPTTTPAFQPPLVLPFDRPVRVLGEGRTLTRLIYKFTGGDPPIDPSLDLVHVTGHYQSIEDLSLEAGPSPFGEGHGSAIRIWRTEDIPNDDGIVFGAAIRRVAIFDAQGYGINVDDAIRNGVVQCAVWTCFEDLLVQNCDLGGVRIGARTTTQFFRNCNFRSMGWRSSPPNSSVLCAGTTGVSFTDCIFDALLGTAVSLVNTSNVMLSHCWFEGRPNVGVPCIDASGSYDGLAVHSCIFIQIWDTDPLARHDMMAIRVGGTGRSVSIIDANVWLVVGNAALGTQPHILVLPPASGAAYSEVTITGGAMRDSTGDQSAPHTVLRIQGSDCQRAMLGASWRSRLNSLTTTARDSVTDWTAGDMIFNSTGAKAQVFDGTVWRDLY